MSNEQLGPHVPQSVDTTSELYRLLRQRLRDLNIYILQKLPEQYQHNDEANGCKEALRLWMANVGGEKRVLTVLDHHRSLPERDDMFDRLWALHQVVDDMEIAVGWRTVRTDSKPARPKPFEHFHALIYTYSQDTERFSSLTLSYPHYKTSNSSPTPPPADSRNPVEHLNGSPIPTPTRFEHVDRSDNAHMSQNHLRNDSHSEYIKKEEPSPFQGYQTLDHLSHPYFMRSPDSGFKAEDSQADFGPPTISAPISPSISVRTHRYSPASSSPDASEPWSPETSVKSTLFCPPSSLDDNRRSHHNHSWASTVLHLEEQPIVMQTRIPPNPSFQSTNHNPIPPASPTRAGSWFTSFQQSPASSPPSRRPEW